jgi:uncharacterized membrane protein
MSERSIRLSGAALTTAGAAIAGYLLYVRSTGGALVCATGGCETVQQSQYAEVLGVPVAAIGLVGFLGLLGAALAHGEWARLIHATLAVSAFLFAGYLLVLQIFVIDSICEWCVLSDVLTTAIVALALLRLRCVAVAAHVPAGPVRPYPKRRPNGNRGPDRKPRPRTQSR